MKNKFSRNTIDCQNILILSEDESSFPSYLNTVLTMPNFRFRKQNHSDLKTALEKYLPSKNNNYENYLIKTDSLKQTKIAIICPQNMDAESIVKKAQEINEGCKTKFNKIYCVFDYVVKNKHLHNHNKYKGALKLGKQLMKNFSNIEIINSVPSYEFWLLSHFCEYSTEILDDKNVEKKLEKEISRELGIDNFKYSKSDNKNTKDNIEFVINKIIEKKGEERFDSMIIKAIKNCKKLDEAHQEDQTIDENPSSKIYKIFELIRG